MSKRDIQKILNEYKQDKDTKYIERVVCYIRVSTTEQKLHGLSLDAQRDTLTRYAEAHGLKIVGWYEDEGVSGRKLIKRRPALQRMLNDAKEGLFDRIIFIKLDRYFRSVAEYHESQKILEKHNVLWTATEEVYDLTTANGRFWIQQKLAMAEYEADNTGERIKLVNEYKVRDSQATTGAQSQGIAFTVVKDENGVKRVVPDPVTKDICMDYINHFLTYQNKRQATLYVNEKYNKKIHYNSFSKMLKDTKLYGYYKGNRNYCTPYINKATFDKIQAALGNNIKTQSSKRIYLFSGLIRCPHCDNIMSGTNSNKRTVHTNYGKGIYHYKHDIKSYRCNNYAINKLCDYNKRPNEKKIEASLLDKLDGYMTAYISDCKIEDARRQDNHAEQKIKDLNEELRKTNRMYKNNALTDEEYDKEVAEIKERIALAEAQLEPLVERDLTRYEELLKNNWRDLYEALNDENKRAFWRKYVKQIVVDEKANLHMVIFF